MTDYDGGQNVPEYNVWKDDIKSISIDPGITHIGNYAFTGFSSLISITIPAGVTSIGRYAFGKCSNLEEVIFSDESRLRSIGDYVFYKSGITAFHIPASVTDISVSTAFLGCTGLETITVDSGNANYSSADGVLFNKDRTTLLRYPGGKHDDYTIPDTVTAIREQAFWTCKIPSVTIPASVTSIGREAFSFSGLDDVTILRGGEDLYFDEIPFDGGVVKEVTVHWDGLPEGLHMSVSIDNDAFTIESLSDDTATVSWTSDHDFPARLSASLTADTSEKPMPEPPTVKPGPEFHPVCRECRLPATGFSSRRAAVLPAQPKEIRYTSLRMRLMIPSLDTDTELVSVPLSGKEWRVEWLGSRAGILEGSALPGEGVSVIAAHNTLNDTAYGPFALLRTLEPNDLIISAADDGDLKLFRVYANELLSPDDTARLEAIALREKDTLVLVTCENESAEGGYLNRRVIFASQK